MATYTRDEIMSAAGCGTQIADDAVEHGYMPTLLADNGKIGDARMALYQCGDVRAIDTNGHALWEESVDRDAWADAMAEIDG